jgi:hypothetical protein
VIKVTMEIPPARASQMATFFIDERFEVSWDGPLEKRGGGLEGEVVRVVFWLKDTGASGIVGGAAYTAAQNALGRICTRFSSVKAEVQEEEGEGRSDEVEG